VIYSVRAKYREGLLSEFYGRLTDGTILAQEPDGREIVASMKRARITSPGVVEWSEKCFCDPPLKHERETVYDRYLTDMEIEAIEDYVDFEGESFMGFMGKEAGKRKK